MVVSSWTSGSGAAGGGMVIVWVVGAGGGGGVPSTMVGLCGFCFRDEG